MGELKLSHKYGGEVTNIIEKLEKLYWNMCVFEEVNIRLPRYGPILLKYQKIQSDHGDLPYRCHQLNTLISGAGGHESGGV